MTKFILLCVTLDLSDNLKRNALEFLIVKNPNEPLRHQENLLGLIYTVHYFLIATAIPLIATNGLHITQWKCSHYAPVTISPTAIQPIISENKSQSQIVQCERALRNGVGMVASQSSFG